MLTKRNTLICDICRKFCAYFDEWTPFGCADPEAPEPYDPSHICKRCSSKVKQEWIERFNKGYRHGDWQKSKAEMEAAEICGLKWVDGGLGTLDSKNWADQHQYISKKEHDRLSKFPYWGYCKKCNAERKGGYCSKSECSESFQRR